MSEEIFEYHFDESLLDDCPLIVKNMVEAEKMIFNIAEYDVNTVAQFLITNFPGNKMNYIFRCIAYCQSKYKIFTRDLARLWLLLPGSGDSSLLTSFFKGYLYKIGAPGISQCSMNQNYFSEWYFNDDVDYLKRTYDSESKIDDSVLEEAIENNAVNCANYIKNHNEKIKNNYYSYHSYHSFGWGRTRNYQSIDFLLAAIKSHNKYFIDQQKSFSSKNSLARAIEYHCDDRVIPIIKNYGIQPTSLKYCYSCFNTLAFVFFYKLNVHTELYETMKVVTSEQSVEFIKYLDQLADEVYIPNRHSLKDLAIEHNNPELFMNETENDEELPENSLQHFTNKSNIECVKYILSKRRMGFSETKEDWELNSPLATAYSNNCLKLVQIFVERGADPNVCFSSACSQSDYQIVKYLVDKGAECKSQNLETAIRNKNHKIAELLISKGVKILRSYLKIACSNNDFNTAKLLLENHAIPYDECLSISCSNNNLDITKLLLENGVKANSRNLNTSCSNNNFDITKLLLENRATVTDEHLQIACYNNNFDITKLLLEYGAPVMDKHLQIACSKNNYEISKLLLENGAKPMNDSMTYDYQYKIVELLVIHEADPNLFLRSALSRHSTKTIEFLLKNGADPNRVFVSACENSNLEIVMLLVLYGADSNLKLYNEFTVQEKLLENPKFQVSEKDQERNAFYQSLSSRDQNIPIFLMKQGANTHFKLLRSPLLVAVDLCYTELFDELVKDNHDINETFKIEITDNFINKEDKEVKEYVLINALKNIDNDADPSKIKMLQKVLEYGPNIELVKGKVTKKVISYFKSNYYFRNNDTKKTLSDIMFNLFKEVQDSLDKEVFKDIFYSNINNNRTITHYIFDNNLYRPKLTKAYNLSDNYFMNKLVEEHKKEGNEEEDDNKEEEEEENKKLSKKATRIKTKEQIEKEEERKVLKRIEKQKEIEKQIREEEEKNTIIRFAIENSHLDELRDLYDNGIDIINFNKGLDHTALMYAVINNRTDVIEYLLSIGDDINNNSNESPLSYAINQNDVDMVRFLHDKGAINTSSSFRHSYRRSSRHYRDYNEFDESEFEKRKQILEILDDNEEYNKELIEIINNYPAFKNYMLYLIDKGANNVDINDLNKLVDEEYRDVVVKLFNVNPNLKNLSLVADAVQKEDISKLKFWIENQCDINAKTQFNSYYSYRYNSGSTPLELAISSGNKALISILIDNNVDLNDTEAAFIAMRKENYSVASKIFNGGVSVINNNEEFFDIAYNNKSTYGVSFLLKHGLDLSKLSLNAIKNVIRKDDRKMISFCYDNGMKIPLTIDQESTVVYTTNLGRCASLDFILEKGYSSETDDLGNNPLCIAIRNNNKELIQTLIKHNAKLNGRVEDVSNTFLENVRNNNLQYIRMLLEAGAYWDYRNESEATALCIAAGNGHLGLVKLLLEYGANPDAKDTSNNTALIYAVRNKHTEIAEYLIVEGECNIYACNGSAFEITLNNFDSKTMQVLIDHGYKVSLTPLIVEKAVRKNNLEFIKFIIENGGDINEVSQDSFNRRIYALKTAINNGYTNIVKFLIKKGAIDYDKTQMLKDYGKERFLYKIRSVFDEGLIQNINYELKTITEAVRGGFVEIISDLIRLGMDLNIAEQEGCNLLHQAMMNHDKRTIELITENIDFAKVAKIYDDSILCTAIELNYDDIAIALIENGMNLTKQTVFDQGTLVHYSIIYNKPEILRLLIDRGADIEKASDRGVTPLLYAVSNNKLDFVNILLENEADVNKEGANGDVPLLVALRNNNHELIHLLIKNGTLVNKANARGRTPLLEAISQNNLDVAKILLEGEANVNDADNNGRTPLLEAISQNNLEAVQIFLERGAHVNKADNNSRTPLIEAIENNNPEIVKLLLDKKANVNTGDSEGNTPLIFAIRKEYLPIIDILLAKKAKINKEDKQGQTPLMGAIITNNNTLIKNFIKNKVDVNKVDKGGKTPLIQAIRSYMQNKGNIISRTHFLETVTLLIEANANINQGDNKGTTPLFEAIKGGDLDIVKLLLENGADVNLEDKQGKLPLSEAINNHNIDIIRTLIENGALVNQEEKNGTTPLIKAIKKFIPGKSNEIIELLVESGADVNQEDKNHEFPLMIASNLRENTSIYNNENNVAHLIAFLIEKGADVNKNDEQGNSPIINIIRNKNIEGINVVFPLIEITTRIVNELIRNNLYEVLLQIKDKINVHETYKEISPLIAAIQSDRTEIVDLILSLDKDAVHAEGVLKSPIFYAFNWEPVYNRFNYYTNKPKEIINVKSKLTLIKELVEAGVDLNSLDELGNSPLYYTVKENNYALTKYFINHGADTSLKLANKSNYSLLRVAPCDYYFIRLLTSNGADVNERDVSGDTVFAHFLSLVNRPMPSNDDICSNLNDHVLDILIENGADVNGKDNNGTPFFFRARNNIDIIKYLLEKGLDINARDAKGKTVLLQSGINPVQLNKLITIGADPLIEDEDGYNLLFTGLKHGITYNIKKVVIGTTDLQKMAQRALDNDNPEMLKFLMKNMYDITTIIKKDPLVIYAYQHNLTNIMDYLLREDSKEAEKKDRVRKRTLFMHLVKQNDMSRVRSILYSSSLTNFLCNEPDNRGITPLMVAAYERNHEMAQLLIQYGADLNAKDNEGKTALQRAITLSCYEMANYLVSKGADINTVPSTGKTFLIKAVESLDKKEVNNILYNKANADINLVVKGVPTIMKVLETGKDGVAKLMITQGCTLDCVNSEGETPLHVACRTKCSLVFKHLMEVEKANVNAVDNNGRTPLMNAISSGVTKFFKELLNHDADISKINNDGDTALTIAVTTGKVAYVKELLNRNADITPVNNKGRNALAIAVALGHDSIVKLLLKHNPDCNFVDKKGESLLYTACKRGFTNIAKVIAPKTDDVDFVCEKTGNTILTEAAYRGRADCIKILIKYKVDINKPNACNKTPLMLAAENGRKESVKILLKRKGLDINAKDNDNKTAYDLARTEEIKELIMPKKVDDKEKEEEDTVEEKPKRKYMFVMVPKKKKVKGCTVTTMRRKRVFIDENQELKEKLDKERKEKKEKKREETIRANLMKKFPSIKHKRLEEMVKEKLERPSRKYQKETKSLLMEAIERRKRERAMVSSESDASSESENE